MFMPAFVFKRQLLSSANLIELSDHWPPSLRVFRLAVPHVLETSDELDGTAAMLHSELDTGRLHPKFCNVPNDRLKSRPVEKPRLFHIGL
jgi:hypothetical protein